MVYGKCKDEKELICGLEFVGVTLNKNTLLGILVLVCIGMSSPSLAVELTTAAQESVPKYYKLGDGTMGGLCVDLMLAIEAIEPEIHFNGYQEFLPFKRLQYELEIGQLDSFFGIKKTEQRIAKYTFLDVPLYRLDYVLAVRIDDDVIITSFDDVRSLGAEGKVITVHASATNRFLDREGGLLVESGARTPTVMLNMLVAGRGRFAFYHDLGLKSAVNSVAFSGKIKTLPVSFSTYYHYAAFSKKTSEETIEKIRGALDTIKKNGTLALIQNKYNLRGE